MNDFYGEKKNRREKFYEKKNIYYTSRAFLAAAGRPRFIFWPKGTLFAFEGTSQSSNRINKPSECLHVKCLRKKGHEQ